MIHGNTDSRTYKIRRRMAVMADGRCLMCPPHRGENGWNRNVRWIDGQPVKRKGKAVK